MTWRRAVSISSPHASHSMRFGNALPRFTRPWKSLTTSPTTLTHALVDDRDGDQPQERYANEVLRERDHERIILRYDRRAAAKLEDYAHRYASEWRNPARTDLGCRWALSAAASRVRDRAISSRFAAVFESDWPGLIPAHGPRRRLVALSPLKACPSTPQSELLPGRSTGETARFVSALGAYVVGAPSVGI